MTDFGISRDWSGRKQDTTQGPTYKTLRYSAPEVALGEAKNSSSDVWSLGCVFLEIWTVLNNRTTSDLTSFMESTASESRSYYANTDAIKKWCGSLARSCGIEGIRSLGWISSMLQSEPGKRSTIQSLCYEISEVDDDPEISYSFTGRCCTEEDDGFESVDSSEYEMPPPDVVAGTITAAKALEYVSPVDLETRSATNYGPSLRVCGAISQRSRDRMYRGGDLLGKSLTDVEKSRALREGEQSSIPSLPISGPIAVPVPHSMVEKTTAIDEVLETVVRLRHHNLDNESTVKPQRLLRDRIAMPENRGLKPSRRRRPPAEIKASAPRSNNHAPHLNKILREQPRVFDKEPHATASTMEVANQTARLGRPARKIVADSSTRGFFLLPVWSETDVSALQPANESITLGSPAMKLLAFRDLRLKQNTVLRSSSSLRTGVQMRLSTAERKARQHLKHQKKKLPHYGVSTPRHQAPGLEKLQLKELLHTTNGTIRALMFGRAVDLDLKSISNLPNTFNMNREECKALKKSLSSGKQNPLGTFLADNETIERRLRHVKPTGSVDPQISKYGGPYVKTPNPLTIVAQFLDQLGFAHFTRPSSVECSYPSTLYQRCDHQAKGWRTSTRSRSLFGHMQNVAKDVRNVWHNDLAGASGPWEDSWTRGKIVMDIRLWKDVNKNKEHLTCRAISGPIEKEATKLAFVIQELCRSLT